MQKYQFDKYLKLRLAVASMGEIGGWWRSSFMDNGPDFLSYTFPRTRFKATIKSLWEVASSHHDDKLGARKYHLFRLGEIVEENLFQLLDNEDQNRVILDEISGNELAILKEVSNQMAIDGSQGPILIGSREEISSDDILPVLAAHYYHAFKSDYLTYPYFS